MSDDPKTEEYWKDLKAMLGCGDLEAFVMKRLAAAAQKEIDSTWAEDQRIILEGTGKNKPKGIIYAGLDTSVKELNGFEEQLKAATAPPCGKRKSHNYAADPKALVCSKCGFDRSNYIPLSKKTKEEIAIRVEQLNRILSESEKD